MSAPCLQGRDTCRALCPHAQVKCIIVPVHRNVVSRAIGARIGRNTAEHRQKMSELEREVSVRAVRALVWVSHTHGDAGCEAPECAAPGCQRGYACGQEGRSHR